MKTEFTDRKLQLKPLALLKRIATFIPGIERLACRYSGGTISARYCYFVWLRHLVKAYENGLKTRFNRVAELGPGDSLGVGLAAMIPPELPVVGGFVWHDSVIFLRKKALEISGTMM